MSGLAVIIGIFLIFIVLWDAFETVVLPRRVTRRYRLVRLFYRVTWPVWSGLVCRLFPKKRQEALLSYYGPLSLILLLVLWAVVLITGFGLLYWAQNHSIKTPEGTIGFGACLYFSGTSFFTLGLGDVQPATGLARFLIVLEAGMGFGFLAIVISYLPSIHQSFSRREVNISLLDARAGSPPTAAEILLRNHLNSDIAPLTRLLQQWESWSAELLESHLSFPMLAYFRSQHDNQSWLAALTSILDACSFVIATLEGECVRQARLTFAMARHTLVDLALVLYAAPRKPQIDRLPAENLSAMLSILRAAGLHVRETPESDRRLEELREMYEPYIHSLSERLLLPLPAWILKKTQMDNWQISAWGPKPREEEHF